MREDLLFHVPNGFGVQSLFCKNQLQLPIDLGNKVHFLLVQLAEFLTFGKSLLPAVEVLSLCLVASQ